MHFQRIWAIKIAEIINYDAAIAFPVHQTTFQAHCQQFAVAISHSQIFNIPNIIF